MLNVEFICSHDGFVSKVTGYTRHLGFYFQ